MAQGRFISYLRVSTDKQGQSGLGLEAQRKSVSDYLNGGDWTLIAELVEVESGKNSKRPKLEEALNLCRAYNATLVVAKMDRLTRDAHFLLGLQKADVKVSIRRRPRRDQRACRRSISMSSRGFSIPNGVNAMTLSSPRP
jgi:DNA invertase Pin-like site-specific DNA recombinase